MVSRNGVRVIRLAVNAQASTRVANSTTSHHFLMDDEEPSIIRFDANRDSADSDEQVRCPRCNKWIVMHDTRGEHCGLHFQGEAWEFSPSTRGVGGGGCSGDATVVGGGDCGCDAPCDCARLLVNAGSGNVGDGRLSFAGFVRYGVDGRSCPRCRLPYRHCEFAPCFWRGTS
jgi:hypothetical protein